MAVSGERLQEIAIKHKSTNEIIFGVNPFTAPEIIRQTYKPILESVARKIGAQAKVVIVSDYESLGHAIAKKIVDVGWFSPFAYVSAKEKDKGITPIVTPVVNNSASYKGFIVARKDGLIKNIADLKGKRFAFVDPKSASGYLFPKALLAEQGLKPETYFGETLFLGSHDNVIENVLNGSVDGGATYSEALTAARKSGKSVDDLIIIAETEDIPKDAIAARQGLDAVLVEELRRAFMSMNDKTGQNSGLLRQTGLNGFVYCSDDRYDIIRKVAR
ncbi:MAG: phosphate/phosphite/phosphonate ABC transporter substrate-binding protein [Negativicutes bacterium]|nr:phosphate/phosphite/phosphonate ABC transporter substrate-binding protein [Negativicutes bacterium]